MEKFDILDLCCPTWPSMEKMSDYTPGLTSNSFQLHLAPLKMTWIPVEVLLNDVHNVVMYRRVMLLTRGVIIDDKVRLWCSWNVFAPKQALS